MEEAAHMLDNYSNSMESLESIIEGIENREDEVMDSFCLGGCGGRPHGNVKYKTVNEDGETIEVKDPIKN